MSIIYDALKKVEESSAKEVKARDFGNAHPNPRHKFKTYLLYLLAVCAGFFAVNIFFGFLTHSEKFSGVDKSGPPKVPLTQPQALPPRQQAASEGIPVKMSSKGLLILNGVFFSGDEGYALVNNHIVKEGDAVDGAVVKRITVDGVEAEVDGLILKLTTAQR